MKIRNGFVSNSSSSSFIIGGPEVNTKEDLLPFLNLNKTQLKHILKESCYSTDNPDVNEFLDYLFNCFKYTKVTNKIKQEEDFDTIDNLRKFVEVDYNYLLESLNHEGSMARMAIEDNIAFNLLYSNICFNTKKCNSEELQNEVDYAMCLDELDDKIQKKVLKYYSGFALEKFRNLLLNYKNYKEFKLYTVTFSTDDGEVNKYDYMLRDGKDIFNYTCITLKD